MAWNDGRTGERVVFDEDPEDENEGEPERGGPYTWEDAARDIALVTNLTLSESIALTSPLRELLPAEGATHSLVRLFKDHRSDMTPNDRATSRGEAIAELVKLVAER